MTKTAAPRVAVCIPTHNRAGFLRHAIDSVLNQTYEHFSLLVSDNASTDETADVVASVGDARISYVRLERNIGWAGNFNHCLEQTPDQAEYVLLLCDDDLLYPRHLEQTIAVLDREPQVGIVHTGFDLVAADGRLLRESVNWTRTTTRDAIEPGATFIRRSMLWSTRINAASALIRRRALPGVLFDPVDGPAADLGLWLRIALDWKVSFVAEALAGHRVHEGNHSATWGRIVNGAYSPDNFEFAQLIEGVKVRFLDAHSARLDDPAALRRLAAKSARRELVNVARNVTKPRRPLGKTLRMLWEAGRLDPRVGLEPAAWRLVAGSVLGPRLVDRMRAGSTS